MTTNRFVEKMLDWFEKNKRNLPWRNTKDPYKIWLSEVMLQQTRVSQGLPYYERFVKKYPTVNKLAKAPEAELFRLWQGLGYYSRARNLHRCAKIIVERGGVFPDTASELRNLPGIGDYTAAAIASIAFNKPVAVVDGNVFRVLSRLHAIPLDITTLAAKKYFSELANSLISQDRPGDFNQAMMEFGATHCTPRNPLCQECPFAKTCQAFQANSVQLYPVKAKAKARKVRHFTYFVFKMGNKIWMQVRTGIDIWQGLNEFYLIETKRAVSDKKALALLPIKLAPASTKKVRQVLSHQEIEGTFIEIQLNKAIPTFLKRAKGKFYSKKEVEQLAKPVLVNKYLQESH
jgi:A/G-specific adenine glycosylase